MLVLALILASPLSATAARTVLSKANGNHLKYAKDLRFCSESGTASCNPANDPPYTLPTDQNHLDLIYDNDSSAAPRPLVIYVHGGGWQDGNKDVFDGVNTVGEMFYQQGFAFASINYRLLYTYPQCAAEGGEFSPEQEKIITGICANPVPTIPYDLARAIKYLHNHAAKYKIDTSRIVLMGHSAGAHLSALLLANREYLAAVDLDRSAISRAVFLDAHVYDLQLALARGAPYPADTFLQLRPVFNVLVGALDSEQQKASPSHYIRTESSAGRVPFPRSFVLFGPDSVSTTAIHQDPKAAEAQARQFLADLRTREPNGATKFQGKEVEIKHGQFFTDLANPNTEMSRSVLQFLSPLL
jgi:acetyl esterase/lipase